MSFSNSFQSRKNEYEWRKNYLICRISNSTCEMTFLSNLKQIPFSFQISGKSILTIQIDQIYRML